MRRLCYWDEHAEQIAAPVAETKQQRNVNADVVGVDKEKKEK